MDSATGCLGRCVVLAAVAVVQSSRDAPPVVGRRNGQRRAATRVVLSW